MKRKLILLTFALFLFIGTTAAAFAAPSKDVSPGAAGITAALPDMPSEWAAKLVENAKDALLVPENLQSKYTQATTRAEFCALAVTLYDVVVGEEITGRAEFTDTSDENVEKAAAIGVVTGVGDNKFDPDARLTREQAALMLTRLSDAVGSPLTGHGQADDFADGSSVSDWAFGAVRQVQAAGIMQGAGDGRFDPQGAYTREQSIVTILRLFEILNGR